MRQQEQAQKLQRQLLEDSLIRSFLLQEQRHTERNNILVMRLGEATGAFPHSFLQNSDLRLERNVVDNGALARQVGAGTTTTPQPLPNTNRISSTHWAARVAADAHAAADRKSLFQDPPLVDPRPTAAGTVPSEDSMGAIYRRATLPYESRSSQQPPPHQVLLSRTTSGAASTTPTVRPPSRRAADAVEDDSLSSFSDQDSYTPVARPEADDASSSASDCDTSHQQEEGRQPPTLRRNHDQNVDGESAAIRSKQY